MDSEEDVKLRIEEIEKEMSRSDFWIDKVKANTIIEEYNSLKNIGEDEYKKSTAIISIVSGTGGDDAEDFARMLFEMYFKYAKKNGKEVVMLDESKNAQGGYKNVEFELKSKGAFRELENESGVHRLVRISPFNAKSQRHTSFALVDIIPKLPATKKIDLQEDDLKFEISKSGGPGGMNVNKRETAVRVVHTPTGVSVRSDNERTQLRNKEAAIEILQSKLYKMMQEQKLEKIGELRGQKKNIVWGNQIRSYVLHPYKMVKDHRTMVEHKDPDKVLDGDIEVFLK